MALLKVNDDGTIGVNKKKKKKSQADLIVGSDGKISFNSEKYKPEEEDIAPVRTDTERSWFKSGLFEDGWDFGDVTKTILGTNKDLADDLAAGVAGIGEGLIDTGAYAVGGLSKLIGADDFSEKMKKFQERDLVKEYNIADRLVDTVSPGGKIIGIANDILNKGDAEKVSILGEKTDSLVQSAGQLAGTGALQMVGVPWWLTTGVTSFGSGTEQAFQNDATYGEAGAYGLISAGAEVLLEKLSGGIKFGGKALDEGLKRKLTEGITNKTVNTLAKLGFDMAGEGTEEVLTEVITNIGEKLTFADEKTWSELLTSEEAVDGYIESFIGGAVLGGGFSAGKAYKSAKTGRDYDTGLTNNEQSVVNAEVTNRSAEIQKQRAVRQQIDRIIEERERTFGNLSDAEKKSIAQQVQTRLESGELDFTKTQLSKKEIAKIESEVMEDLKKGYIGIDTIENTLSGTKTARLRELEQSLTNTTNEAKKAEIEAEINQIKGDRANELKSLLSKDVLLQESYRQEALRGQEFTREVTEADSDITKELIESAKSSKMNNTRKMHNLFEYTNKIANDTNTKYGFTNNEQLKELGHDVEGKTVNGLVRTNKDGSIKVLINVDSEKAINTIIGHETTHLLEGTNEYKALQNIVKEYATTKGEYDRRFKELSELYKGVNANIENEITADLVGDYLFTDEQFVNNLSTKEPNVFQKVYDFIKHAYKMATAGSKEARQLEQVKRKFDQAYKKMSKAATGKVDSNLTTEADSDTEDAIPVKKESEPETEPQTEEAPLIAKTRKEIRKALLEDNHDIIVAAMENAKNLASPLMNNTDTIRLSEMVFGREAGNKINELIFQKVLDNEAKSVAWQNEQRKAIKNLGIKARSKESAAVQKWGEGEYVDEFGDLREYTDSDLMLEFPDIEVQNKIKNAAIEIRRRYDEYIDLSNQVLTGLGFPPIEKRKNYFMHFQELGDFFSKNGIPFNPQSMSENNLPTDINGLTEFFVPQKKFFASMRRREGKRTVYDAITGIDKYISGVADLIYHTEDIQRGRAFEELIRDTYGQNDAAKANREALPEELRAERLEKQQTAHLSKYVRWLHNWTDNLAGKKNRIDRAIEDLGDRAGFSVLDTARKQVSANMIGFNPASALTNVIASVQAISKTDKAAVAKGTADTIRNIIQKDDFASKNSFLINRFGTDMLSKNMWQKIQDAGFVFMKGMDWFSSNQIVRSKFYELKAQGMTDAEAHAEAGKFAARIMGDRTKGANAMFFNSKLFNTIGQFQLEVNNQLYSIFYDTYQESKEKAKEDSLKTAAGMTFTLGQMFAFTHLFGKTFESVAGYNPTFDVFGIIATALGLGDDEEEDVVDNLQEAAEQLLKALPYSSLFTDGGRIPLASAVPDIGGLITGGKDEYGNDLEFLKEAAKLPYLFLPAGYGQIKKTTKGLGMFSEELPVTGSYTDSGNLRFPVEDTPLNRLQAGIFGQWSNANARDYFDNERKPLGEKQIQEYKDLDIPIKDYWQYREDLKDHKTLEDKFDYIADLDIPVSKKNIMINNIVDRKEAVDMANYDQFASYEEFDWATKNPEKYSYLESIGVSYKQYNASDEAKDAYNWAYKNPEKYGLAKAAAGDVVTYRSYTSALNDLTADKDSNGKTISGSRKTKVADYINSLDADYGSKLILFKSEYPSDDTYNNEIIEYLNNRQDISYDEMVAILTELEFTVRDDGYVTW